MNTRNDADDSKGPLLADMSALIRRGARDYELKSADVPPMVAADDDRRRHSRQSMGGAHGFAYVARLRLNGQH